MNEDANMAVVLERVDNIKNLIAEQRQFNKDEHDSIITQTTKTNGRVTNLELWRAALDAKLIIITSIVCVTMPFIFYLIEKFLNK